MADNSISNIEDIFIVTPMQEAMLFQLARDPLSQALFLQLRLTLEGDLHRPAFERAWQLVNDRHQALRVAFAFKAQDRPRQAVVRQVTLPMQYQDWRSQSTDERRSRLEQLMQEDRQTPFKLNKPPLSRLYLLQVGDQVYHLVWSHSHLILDGWSVGLVLGEVLATYAALRAGREPALPPAPLLKDYVAWLRRQEEEPSRDFWRAQLDGIRPSELPRLEDGDASQSWEHNQLIPTSLVTRLAEFARSSGITRATVFQATWALLLGRLMGENEAVVGVTVSGRPGSLLGSDRMVGSFINNLPLRVRFQPDASVLDWLRTVFDTNVALASYAHVSPAAISHWADLPGSAPLYSSIVVVQNLPFNPEEIAAKTGLTLAHFSNSMRTAMPLTLEVQFSPRATVRLIGSGAYFDAITVEVMLEEYLGLLTEVLSAPNAPLSQLIEVEQEDERVPAVRVSEVSAVRERPSIATDYVPPQGPIETRLTDMLCEVLRLDRIGRNDGFFDLGGDSIQALRIISKVEPEFGVKVPIGLLFGGVITVAVIAEYIDSVLNAARAPAVIQTRSTSLRLESQLDSSIRAQSTPPASTPEAALLTGVTGNLGPFLVAELLKQWPRMSVYCHMRGSDESTAMARLISGMKLHGLWQSGFAERISCVLGDLSAPNLGLTAADFDSLADQVDAVFHNGAAVNFVRPYHSLKAANVLSTHDALRFAAQGRAKQFCFTSTLAVFSASGYHEAPVSEQDLPRNGDELACGYFQSKFVAEEMVRQARDRGMATVLFRPGLISAESLAGSASDDVFVKVLQACLTVGAVPDTQRTLAPVTAGYTAAVMAKLAFREESRGQTFHIVNPEPASTRQLAEIVETKSGRRAELVPFETWAEMLANSASIDSILVHIATSLFDPLSYPNKGYRCESTLKALGGELSGPSSTRIFASYFDIPEVDALGARRARGDDDGPERNDT